MGRAFLLACLASFVAMLVSTSAPPRARLVLVGVGCEGPSAIAIGNEEDELPRCAEIEAHYLRTAQ